MIRGFPITNDEELEYDIPVAGGLHLGKHYWIPSVNLKVYDYNELITGNIKEDLAYYYATEAHEDLHRLTNRLGYIYSRMYNDMLANNLLFKEEVPDIDNAIRTELASDIIHIHTKPLLEAFAAFLTDIQIMNSYFDTRFYAGLNMKYLEALKNLTLKDRNTKKLYKKLHEIWEWTHKSEEFVSNVVMFSLDIPYIAGSKDVLLREPLFEPTTRFEILFEVLENMNDKLPLLERPKTSNLISREKMFTPDKTTEHMIDIELFQLFYKYTGFTYGTVVNTLGKEPKNLFSVIQFLPDALIAQPVLATKIIDNRAQRLDRTFGKDFRKLFLDYHFHYLWMVFKISKKTGKTYFYVPNYKYVNDELLYTWLEYYTMWFAKEWIIKGADKKILLEIIKGMLLKEDYSKRENQINHAYERIDYSKIDDIIVEEFKETSTELGRKLYWN